jgi:hypothetical protein
MLFRELLAFGRQSVSPSFRLARAANQLALDQPISNEFLKRGAQVVRS